MRCPEACATAIARSRGASIAQQQIAVEIKRTEKYLATMGNILALAAEKLEEKAKESILATGGRLLRIL